MASVSKNRSQKFFPELSFVKVTELAPAVFLAINLPMSLAFETEREIPVSSSTVC